MMPFAGFKDFDVCVLAMREKGHNDESARAICGKMQKDAEMAERSLTLGLLSRFAEFLFFDPSQPRDDQGEWTDTGAGARGGVLGSKKSEGATSKRDTGRGISGGAGILASKESKRATSDSEIRRLRAKKSYIPMTRDVHRVALGAERQVARKIGGRDLPDNEPFDVLRGKLAIEVKTVVRGKNPKITMHPESLARKSAYAKKHKVQPWTVVIDKRGGKSDIYVKKGVGSFRLKNMERVKLSGLNAAMGL